MPSDPAMLEVARQLGVIQTLLNQEEVSHRQIMMDLQEMRTKLEHVAVTVEESHDALMPPAEPVLEEVPTLVEDASQLAAIVHRRAKIAAAVAALAGMVLGGAAGTEAQAIVKKLTEVFGGQ